MTDDANHSLQHEAASEWAKFCPRCGSRLEERLLDGELKPQKVCGDCGFIFYLNPNINKVFVQIVEKILMMKIQTHQYLI